MSITMVSCPSRSLSVSSAACVFTTFFWCRCSTACASALPSSSRPCLACRSSRLLTAWRSSCSSILSGRIASTLSTSTRSTFSTSAAIGTSSGLKTESSCWAPISSSAAPLRSTALVSASTAACTELRTRWISSPASCCILCKSSIAAVFSIRRCVSSRKVSTFAACIAASSCCSVSSVRASTATSVVSACSCSSACFASCSVRSSCVNLSTPLIRAICSSLICITASCILTNSSFPNPCIFPRMVKRSACSPLPSVSLSTFWICDSIACPSGPSSDARRSSFLLRVPSICFLSSGIPSLIRAAAFSLLSMSCSRSSWPPSPAVCFCL
mmetsp:Transcript_80208/g.194383  ORF Transcript_80208/g.194383 Transcript_80208/m.194383 type:complete len:328 (+) Transcript_80208:658-1641(+)